MTERIVLETKEFLSMLEGNQIYKFNSKLFKGIKKKQLAMTKRNQIYAYAFMKTINLLENNDDVSQEEKIIFNLTNAANYLMANLEIMKLFLRLLIDPEKILNNEKTTYKDLIRKICDEIKCNSKTRKKFYGNFLVDFRNSIAHNNYDITINGLFYQNNGKVIKLSINDLTRYFYETKKMTDTIEEFINNKTKNLEEIERELKNKEKSIRSQIDELEERRKNLLKKTMKKL